MMAHGHSWPHVNGTPPVASTSFGTRKPTRPLPKCLRICSTPHVVDQTQDDPSQAQHNHAPESLLTDNQVTLEISGHRIRGCFVQDSLGDPAMSQTLRCQWNRSSLNVASSQTLVAAGANQNRKGHQTSDGTIQWVSANMHW